MKLHTVFGVVFYALLGALLLQPSAATNSTWGSVGPYDSLLHRQVVVANSPFFYTVTRNITFPPRGHVNRHPITAIKAIDHNRKNGGYAALYSGGVGYRSATVILNPMRGGHINFTVEFYGRK